MNIQYLDPYTLPYLSKYIYRFQLQKYNPIYLSEKLVYTKWLDINWLCSIKKFCYIYLFSTQNVLAIYNPSCFNFCASSKNCRYLIFCKLHTLLAYLTPSPEFRSLWNRHHKRATSTLYHNLQHILKSTRKYCKIRMKGIYKLKSVKDSFQCVYHHLCSCHL